jgi:GDP-4-dehydro-6-deoxy-D-mannose reductase
MHILITGINGFVGGHLAELLVQQGEHAIWGVSRSGVLGLPHLRDNVQMQQADLCDAAAVQRVVAHVQPRVIYHLAGQTFVPESFSNPAATLITNIVAQLHILQALIDLRHECRVLVVSSNEVYGMVRPEDVPIDETAPLQPATPYGVSKASQDLLALQYHLSHGLDVVRVRPFNHIGPRQDERFVAASFAQQVAQIEQGHLPPVMRVGDLSPQRDFTDVRDMVRAYVLAVEHAAAGEVYNLGTGQPIAVQRVLDILLQASPIAIDVQPDPARMRPINVPLVACNAQRFRARTGWHPEIPLEQTIHDILEYWRLHTRAHSNTA